MDARYHCFSSLFASLFSSSGLLRQITQSLYRLYSSLRRRLLCAGLLALALFITSCTISQKGIQQVDKPTKLSFHDTESQEKLPISIEQSIRYYKRLPADSIIQYGDLTYSPQEMIASMKLFMHLRESSPDQNTFQNQLLNQFLFFEARASSKKRVLFTGYYEPELSASLTPTAALNTPVYAVPKDLVLIRLGEFPLDLPRQTVVGKRVGQLIKPYESRREIQVKKALKGRAKVIAYMNQVELFFLQIQGSGILKLPDNKRIYIGYASGNGHPYRSLGAEMVSRGLMKLEDVSLQSLKAYLRQNPQQVDELLYTNPSYVFFEEREPGYPIGNIQVPLTPNRSIALDYRLFPQGGLTYVSTQLPPQDGSSEVPKTFSSFMLTQDTGGAIRGYGRGDLFFGSGEQAEWLAGHMREEGRLILLVAQKLHLAPFMDNQ